MNEPTAQDTFKANDLLNNTYRIEALIGRGGISEVYRAHSDISGRVVALKVLRPEFAQSADYMALMRREEDIREIRHDAVVRYYDNQRTPEGHVYLVMDYVEGTALEDLIERGGMPVEDVLSVGARVAEGLAVAHAGNVVHRDLSPDNIILRDGNPADPVIIDFGIAKDATPGAKTVIGNRFAGKLAFAAPEQLRGQADARADIYALGAVLLAAYRGAVPETSTDLMSVVEMKSRPLDTEGVPEPLRTLIDRMTDPDRDRRLQSAAEVVEMIRHGVHHGAAPHPPRPDPAAAQRTVVAPPRPVTSPPSPAQVAPEPAADPAPAPPRAEVSPPSPPRRRGRALLVVFLLLVAVGAAGAGGYFSGAFDTLLGPKYPRADPYKLVMERKAGGPIRATGNVPSPDIRDALTTLLGAAGGQASLTLATGDIAPEWGQDMLALVNQVKDLPEWRIEATGNDVSVTGTTLDPAEQKRITAKLKGDGMPKGLAGSVDIALGPPFVTGAILSPLLKKFADCGEVKLVDPPFTGYPHNAEIAIAGNFAAAADRDKLGRAITAIAGDRSVKFSGNVLNPSLCAVAAALPEASPAGVEFTFGYGTHDGTNPTGRYVVGDNPVIDITIPADVTTGYLFVSAVDVSGNVFHMLPNLNRPDNSVNALRGGRSGPLTVRVAYSLAEAKDSKKLAFLVDASSLGKTEILVIHAESQIFDGLRPTSESANAFAEALRSRSGGIESLDSRLLTMAAKP